MRIHDTLPRLTIRQTSH